MIDKEASFSKIPAAIRLGYLKDLRRKGSDSLLLTPARWLGGKKAQNFIDKKISYPALKADTYLGDMANRATSKVTPFKNVFKIKEKVPLGDGKFQEFNRSSLAAPVTKTTGFALPVIGAMTVDEKVGDYLSKNKKEKMTKKASYSDKVILEKTAAVKLAKEMFRLRDELSKLARASDEHSRKERATQLLFKQASLGLCEMPSSYGELQEKIASLCTEDLDVIEKALEFHAGDTGLGKLASEDSQTGPVTPEKEFANAVFSSTDFF
jgi:hypothetical protein